jgi:hypothetical protein
VPLSVARQSAAKQDVVVAQRDWSPWSTAPRPPLSLDNIRLYLLVASPPVFLLFGGVAAALQPGGWRPLIGVLCIAGGLLLGWPIVAYLRRPVQKAEPGPIPARPRRRNPFDYVPPEQRRRRRDRG